jgi:hypothetical protein
MKNLKSKILVKKHTSCNLLSDILCAADDLQPIFYAKLQLSSHISLSWRKHQVFLTVKQHNEEMLIFSLTIDFGVSFMNNLMALGSAKIASS